MKLKALISQLLQFEHEHPEHANCEILLSPFSGGLYQEPQLRFDPEDHVMLIEDREE